MAAFLLSGGLLFPALRAAESNDTTTAVAVQPNGVAVQIEDIQLFTHLALIPAGADPGTIRFQKARLVLVTSKLRYAADERYCAQLAFRDPGGSMACPDIRTEARVPAYQVTFSLTGQPLASDEFAGRDFTFSVYFRPNELAPEVQEALSAGKLSRSAAATYFAVSTSPETARRVAIDGERSHFCAGNYVDGAWVHAAASCNDTISYTQVEAPSGYIGVTVDAASSTIAYGQR
jgi:hypothetical protein